MEKRGYDKCRAGFMLGVEGKYLGCFFMLLSLFFLPLHVPPEGGRVVSHHDGRLVDCVYQAVWLRVGRTDAKAIQREP